MIKTGDLVKKIESPFLNQDGLLIVYDDLGDSSQECFVLPLKNADKGQCPVRITKSELSIIMTTA